MRQLFTLRFFPYVLASHAICNLFPDDERLPPPLGGGATVSGTSKFGDVDDDDDDDDDDDVGAAAKGRLAVLPEERGGRRRDAAAARTVFGYRTTQSTRWKNMDGSVEWGQDATSYTRQGGFICFFLLSFLAFLSFLFQELALQSNR